MSANTVGVISAFSAMLRRDLIMSFRHRNEVSNPLVFAFIVISLFPLALGPEQSTLAALAPGLVWVVALLACMLSTDGMFKADFDDGALEQWLLSPQPVYVLVMAKIIAHWVATGLVISLISPILGVMLALPDEAYLPLVLSLLIGSLALSAIGAIGAGLTVGLRRGGLLVSLLVLPIYVPILIFGVSLVDAAVQQLAWLAYMAVLSAMAILALVLAPLAVGGALRLHLEG